MGNKSEVSSFNFQNSIPQTSTLLKLPHKKDDRYGGDIYVDYDKKLAYRILEVSSQELKDYQFSTSRENQVARTFNFKKFLQARMKLGYLHPHLLTVKNYRVQKSKSKLLCSFGQEKVIMQFPYSTNHQKKNLMTLQDRISQYCKIQRPFPQHELRDIFSQIVTILLFLKQNRTCHGDIKPKNIVLNQITQRSMTPKSNMPNHGTSRLQAFLIDSFLANIGKTSYQIVLQNPQSLSLLSPELLDDLNSKKMPPNQNLNPNQQINKAQKGLYPKVHRTQIFAVGLCMLEAMTAQNAMQCYDLAGLKIKEGYFDHKGEQMRNYGYSNDLVQLVLACLGVKQQSHQPNPQVHNGFMPQNRNKNHLNYHVQNQERFFRNTYVSKSPLISFQQYLARVKPQLI